MQRIRNLLKNKRIRRILIIVTTAVVATTSVFIYRSVYSIDAYYSKRLQRLHKDLKVLPEYLQLSDNTDQDLKEYNTYLNTTATPCKQIRSKTSKLKKKLSKDKQRQPIDKADQLCMDLAEIIAYQRRLYSSLDVYLTLNIAHVDGPASPQLGTQLNEIQSTITNTLRALRSIDYPRVKDPALSELISQLEEAEKQAEATQEALSGNDQERAQASFAQLRNIMLQDKQDFLLARNYFWNNTVDYEALLLAIENLYKEFQT